MLTCMTNRIRLASDAHPAHDLLCLQSARHRPAYACNPQIDPLSAAWSGPIPSTFLLSPAKPAVTTSPRHHSISIHPPR